MAAGARPRLTGNRTEVTRRQLGRWGAQAGGGLIALGLIVILWKGQGWGKVPLSIGIVFAILGLSGLRLAVPLYRAWHALVGAVLWLWTRLALLLTFAIAIIPLALIGRLIGRDRMRLRFPGREASYWQEHRGPERPDRYRRQF